MDVQSTLNIYKILYIYMKCTLNILNTYLIDNVMNIYKNMLIHQKDYVDA
jgi:hypothetical protein